MFCPSCGEELADDAKFCKNCGKEIRQKQPEGIVQNQEFNVERVEESYKLTIIIGYILAILIPILGIIVAIYLYTRKDSQKANRHAKYILIVAIIVWILSVISVFH